MPASTTWSGHSLPEPRSDRPDLVLVHGLGSASSYWDNLRPALERHYRVTAVDLPGHGPGAVDLTAEEARPERLAASVADELGRRGIHGPAHLVGLSLGGWVVLEMAALGRSSGGPPASVTAFAPAGLWRAGATIPLEREEVLLHHVLAVVDPFVPLLARIRLVRQLGLRKNVAHPERATPAQFAAAARALRQARGYGVCDRAACDDRFDRGGRIEPAVPVTVAFGDADRTLPPDSSQERSLLPAHADWVTVADCGHAMTWDHPDACIELIRATTARAAVGR